MEHILSQDNFNIGIAVLFQRDWLQMGVLGFQKFDIDGVSCDFKIFSDVRFDNEWRARATRLNRCQLELYQLLVYDLVGIYALDSKLGRGAMNVQLRRQIC